MYLPIPYKISYDTSKFQFREIVSSMLEIPAGKSLENLHTIQDYDLLTREKDQKTIWHQRYYENFQSLFLPVYLDLIESIRDQFDYNKIVYQKIPTFRVQLANNNVAVGEWHKDKAYNHGVSEVNFWMPFVNTNKDNTLWMESKEDKGDFKPYTVNYGEILIFSGANLHHGNQKNNSSDTRVSVDFRLVDPEKFISNSNGSINMGTKFEIGGYFEIL
jgi:ectoine hydroxylase-related dioxygenase (phytanoyl-CoA dioxygenase family)